MAKKSRVIADREEMGEWENGRMGEWENGRMEGWKIGSVGFCELTLFRVLTSVLLGGDDRLAHFPSF
ncbi:MAG: hypothetical protein JO271_08360, partial [Verrucomicrobia bacterium]|nr:hypothetical protein [Verrucomicrobiota bacterium]